MNKTPSKHTSKNGFLSLFVSLLLLFSLQVAPPRVFAHAGGGPPFVKVNSEYATTNPLFQGQLYEKGLTIPQDITKSIYVINTPITFEIDLSQFAFTIPADDVDFRWSFFKGENFTTKVTEPIPSVRTTQTFSSPGSYLVSIDARVRDQEYTLVDTVLIHVLPNSSYQLPKGQVVIKSALKSKEQTTFTNSFQAEKSEFLWDFGENSIEKGKTLQKIFPLDYFFTPVIARVVDENGFVDDVGIVVVGEKGKLSFSLLDPNADSSTLSVISQTSSSRMYGPLLFFNVLLLGGVIVLVFIKRKKKKNPTH